MMVEHDGPSVCSKSVIFELRVHSELLQATPLRFDANPPHLIMTYTALLALSILRDDFSRLDRTGLVNLLRATQTEDGRSVCKCLAFLV